MCEFEFYVYSDCWSETTDEVVKQYETEQNQTIGREPITREPIVKEPSYGG